MFVLTHSTPERYTYRTSNLESGRFIARYAQYIEGMSIFKLRERKPPEFIGTVIRGALRVPQSA